jgi:hypothetical protein
MMPQTSRAPSCAGVGVRDGFLWVDWYTSRTDRDWAWIFGMPLRTDIEMVRIPRDALRELSATTPYGLATSTFT